MEKFEYLKSSTLKDEACLGCGAMVRIGLCGGWRVKLNPDPITIEREIEELKSRRPTYELYSTVVGDEPIYRTIIHIAAKNNRKVLATHKCERKLK